MLQENEMSEPLHIIFRRKIRTFFGTQPKIIDDKPAIVVKELPWLRGLFPIGKSVQYDPCFYAKNPIVRRIDDNLVGVFLSSGNTYLVNKKGTVLAMVGEYSSSGYSGGKSWEDVLRKIMTLVDPDDVAYVVRVWWREVCSFQILKMPRNEASGAFARRILDSLEQECERQRQKEQAQKGVEFKEVKRMIHD